MAENISLVPEEPNVIFGNDIALATASVALATVVPSLQVVALSGAIGHMLQVRLLFDQGGTAAGAAQTMSISVDLVGRVG